MSLAVAIGGDNYLAGKVRLGSIREHTMEKTLAAHLHDIADRLQRLAPSHRDPEAYFEQKSELVAELRRLAANDNQKREAT